MVHIEYLKRASFGALFVSLPLLFGGSVCYAEKVSCRLTGQAVKVTVTRVYDGDTLVLSDGRKVRLIGINTPETEKDNRPAEPVAKQAAQALRQLAGKQIYMIQGQQQKDHYGRLLAHPFTLLGENITATLLKQGMGFHIVFPPNLRYQDCYRQNEQFARRHAKGVWLQQYYDVRRIDTLQPDRTGFQRVQGRITRIGTSRHHIWLNFGSRFALRLRKKDRHYFAGLDFSKLVGRNVEVRGWLHYYKKRQQFRMQLRHPAAMEIR